MTGPYGKLHSSTRIHEAEFKPCDSNDNHKLQRFRLQKLTTLVEEFDGERNGYCKIDEVDSLGDIPRAESTSKEHTSPSNNFAGCKKFCTDVSTLPANANKGFLSASE